MKIMVFLLLFSSSIFAEISPQLIEKLNKSITPQIGTQIKGTVVGIYDKGFVHYLSYGSLATDSFFEVGSITKTFTSLMLSIAIEKGLVTPETKLSDLRPEWKNQKTSDVTLIELATHRSGLPRNPCNLVNYDPKSPYTKYSEKSLIDSITDKEIAKYSDCKLLPRPSDEILYSNWGSAILGNALSAKTKMSYEKLLKEWITDPLGMKDTVVSLSKEQKKRLNQGHNKKLEPTPLWKRKSMFGNGAIMMTPTDLMIYAKAMLRPELTPIEKAIKRVQTTQHKNIAYNWFVTPAGSLWHNGSTGGFSSFLKTYIKKDFAIFFLINSEDEMKCFIETVEDFPCK